MEIQLSGKMLASIDEQILKIRGARSILDVYKTAELIRLAHINENVAREDIIDQLVLRAGSNTVLEFRTPDNELDGILDFIDDSEIELLMPVESLKLVH